MKIAHLKVFITFVIYIDTTFPESIQISRFIPNRNETKWQLVKDSFVIPQSECRQENSKTRGNHCQASCQNITGRRYLCRCSKWDATVTYVNNTWRCLGNKEVRNQLGCANNTLFHSEKNFHQLRTLNTLWDRRTALYHRAWNCVVNISSSWFIGCDGDRVPLRPYTNRTKKMFHLLWKWNLSYFIQVVDPVAIFEGRVINLGISCSQPSDLVEEACLLFKLNGTINCPLRAPTSPVFSSTSTPSTSSLVTTSLSTTLVTTATKETIGPTQQTTTQANLGSTEKSDDINSSSPPLGIIAGVTVSVILVLLLIFAFLLYRRRKSRNDAHTSTDGQIDTENSSVTNSKSNPAFQLEERNRYSTNGSPSSFINLKKSLLPPQNTGPLSTDNPLYFSVEVPSGTDTGTPPPNAPHEPEPEYNALQEPYGKGSDEPAWYGSLTVDAPYYSTLEGPYQPDSSPRSNANEPFYNVLEAPYPSNAGEEKDSGPMIAQNPVYEVLDHSDKSSENLLYSSNTEIGQPNGSENVPVYAMVNEEG